MNCNVSKSFQYTAPNRVRKVVPTQIEIRLLSTDRLLNNLLSDITTNQFALLITLENNLYRTLRRPHICVVYISDRPECLDSWFLLLIVVLI